MGHYSLIMHADMQYPSGVCEAVGALWLATEARSAGKGSAISSSSTSKKRSASGTYTVLSLCEIESWFDGDVLNGLIESKFSPEWLTTLSTV